MIKDKNIVLISFVSEDYSPCNEQDSVIEELKKLFNGGVDFKKIDIDNDLTNELISKYDISFVPAIVIEKNGTLFKKHVGLTPKDTLVTDLKIALKQEDEHHSNSS